MDPVAPVTTASDDDGHAARVPEQARRDGRGWPLDLVAVIGIIAVYLLAQWWLFPGVRASDPALYLLQGRHWPHVTATYWTLRIGLMAMVRVLEVFFGSSVLVLLGIPIAATALLAVASYAVVRVVDGDRIVAVAAALVAILNQDMLLNTPFLFPDGLSTAIFMAGIFFLLLARRDGPLRPRWASTVAILAGLLLGYTYLVREFSPTLIPVVLVALVLSRYTWRRTILVVLAALANFVAELIYGQIYYGDPFERLHVLTQNRPTPLYRLEQWAPFRADVHNVFQAALIFPRLLLAFSTGWLVVALLVPFAVALVWRRDRWLWLFASWVVTVWVFMTAAAMIRSSSGDPIVEVGNIRYWTPILPALAIGGILGLALLVRGRTPSLHRVRAAQASSVLAAAAILIPGAVTFHGCLAAGIEVALPTTDLDQFRTFLASPQGQQIHTITSDNETARYISIYSLTTTGHRIWHGTAISQKLTKPVESGDLLIGTQRAPKSYAMQLTGSWHVVWHSSGDQLALLAKGDDPRDPLNGTWISNYHRQPFVAGTCGASPYADAPA